MEIASIYTRIFILYLLVVIGVSKILLSLPIEFDRYYAYCTLLEVL